METVTHEQAAAIEFMAHSGRLGPIPHGVTLPMLYALATLGDEPGLLALEFNGKRHVFAEDVKSFGGPID